MNRESPGCALSVSQSKPFKMLSDVGGWCFPSSIRTIVLLGSKPWLSMNCFIMMTSLWQPRSSPCQSHSTPHMYVRRIQRSLLDCSSSLVIFFRCDNGEVLTNQNCHAQRSHGHIAGECTSYHRQKMPSMDDAGHKRPAELRSLHTQMMKSHTCWPT